MKPKSFVLVVGFLVTVALASTSAQALTTSSLQINIQAVTGQTNPVVPLGYPVSNTLSGTLSTGANGSLSATSGSAGEARSPWTTLTSPSPDPIYDREFQWVNNGNITYDLAGQIPEGKALAGSLLWGSPDDFNYLDLYLGTEKVATLTPGTPFGPPENLINTYLVSFSGVVFDKLVVGSSNPSFELANLSVTAVPIPPAAVLFLSGLLGLFFLSRRRNGVSTGPHQLAG